MSLTAATARSATREGVRRCLWWSRLSAAEFEEMTIEELRDELKESLEPELPSEGARLLELSVSIRRQFRKRGFLVEIPTLAWFRSSSRQGESLTVLADWIRETFNESESES